ncbi:MAG: hypothetical protein ACE5GJ_09765 [Gemmatimonadota bacterium]
MSDPTASRPLDEGAPRPSPEVLLARAGWYRVRDRIIRRCVHDLNGRTTSLMAISELIRRNADQATILEYLDQETDQIAALSWTLSALPTDLTAPPEPLDAGELVRLAASLLGRDGEGVAVEAEGEPPPILVARERILAVLLLCMAGRDESSSFASPHDRTETMTVVVRPGEDTVEIEITPVPPLPPADALPELPGPGAGGASDAMQRLGALRELLDREGGTLTETEGAGVRLVFPDLKARRASLRARE